MDIDVIVERKSFDVELEIGNPVVEVKAPDHYNGPFDIFPSDEDQIIPVKEKMPVEDICVKGITDTLVIDKNGTYDVLDKKEVVVDIPATGFDKGTVIFDDVFETTVSQWNVTTLPDGSAFSFDKIECEFYISNPSNTGWRQYWRSDLPMTGNVPHMFNAGVSWITGYTGPNITKTVIEMTESYAVLKSFGNNVNDPIGCAGSMRVVPHDGYNKITAYGWWSWTFTAGSRLKIVGYNRIGDE